MEKAVIYARVSTEEQANGYSLDAQLDACREYAQSKGYDVVEEYVDAGFCAGTDNRPGFKGMIADSGREYFFIDQVMAFIITEKRINLIPPPVEPAHAPIIINKNTRKLSIAPTSCSPFPSIMSPPV